MPLIEDAAVVIAGLLVPMALVWVPALFSEPSAKLVVLWRLAIAQAVLWTIAMLVSLRYSYADAGVWALITGLWAIHLMIFRRWATRRLKNYLKSKYPEYQSELFLNYLRKRIAPEDAARMVGGHFEREI